MMANQDHEMLAISNSLKTEPMPTELSSVPPEPPPLPTKLLKHHGGKEITTLQQSSLPTILSSQQQSKAVVRRRVQLEYLRHGHVHHVDPIVSIRSKTKSAH
jgi:hypothetical protein